MEKTERVHVDVYQIIAINAGNTTYVGAFDCDPGTPIGEVVAKACEGAGRRLRRVKVILDRE